MRKVTIVLKEKDAAVVVRRGTDGRQRGTDWHFAGLDCGDVGDEVGWDEMPSEYKQALYDFSDRVGRELHFIDMNRGDERHLAMRMQDIAEFKRELVAAGKDPASIEAIEAEMAKEWAGLPLVAAIKTLQKLKAL